MAQKLDAIELATKADAYKAIRDKRLEMQREVDIIEESEKALKRELLEIFAHNKGLTGIVGQTHTFRRTTKSKPQVADWDALYLYIQETGEFELLQRRVGEKAVKERWDENEVVPGVIETEVEDISIRKN